MEPETRRDRLVQVVRSYPITGIYSAIMLTIIAVVEVIELVRG